MDKKKKRLIYRITILTALGLAIGITIYFSSFHEEKTALETVGDQAPNFVSETLVGSKLELEDSRSGKTLVNFWGTWCEPCKREMPALEGAYSNYKDKGFSVVSVNLGQSNLVVEQFTKQYDLSFPVVIDKDGSIRQAYYVGKLPASFLVNSDGIIEEVHEGEVSEEMLEDWIN